MTGPSSFPMSVDDLLPRVRARAVELGRVPSRNQVMAEFKVGAPKARAVLAALDGIDLNLAGQSEVTSGRRLHSVPSEDHRTDSVEPDAPDDGG